MSVPFLGEIRVVSFNFPPRGWALCNGQLLAISQNQALFSLLGTTYGGNGTSTFALPNFQSRVPLHAGGGFILGESGGESAHTLTSAEMPAHTHTAAAQSGAASATAPTNAVWAPSGQGANKYSGSGSVSLASGAIATVGGSQPHTNMPPYLTLNFIIALQGIYPSRS